MSFTNGVTPSNETGTTLGYPQTKKPYLGIPEVVGEVWGGLIGGIFDRAVAVAGGDMTAEKGATEDAAAYAQAAKVMDGQDPAYEPVKGWNTEPGPDGMAAYIERRLAGQMHPDYFKPPFRGAMGVVMLTVGQVHNLMGRLGEVSEEDAAAEVQRLIDEATALCLGTAHLGDEAEAA